MIIVKIIGGLGNQMFQYAAAYALAANKQVPLKLDVSAFSTYNLHQGFELSDVFNCSAEIAKDKDLQNVLGWQSVKPIRSLLTRYNFLKLRSNHLIVEPSFSYWKAIVETPDESYLTGYWQTEKYFIDVSSKIRQEFTFRQSLSEKNAEFASLISKVNSVSLHVRRGDYVKDARNIAIHGLCSINYYSAALHHIAEHVENAHIFVFSDDIEWVKQNLEFEFPVFYVDHNMGDQSFNDMRLMSMCNHNIIANSSFSWWGAWLNQNSNKIVIAPNPWFESTDLSAEDLIPKNWIKYGK